MKIPENIKLISDSLGIIGLADMSEQLETSIREVATGENVVATMAITFSKYAVEKKSHKGEMLFKRSKLPERAYFNDLWKYPARGLNFEQVEDLAGLHFMADKSNILIEGASGQDGHCFPGWQRN